MKIVVLVKEVPDTYGDRELDLETGLTRREAGEAVLDEIGARALELAASYAEEHAGTEVVAATVGPESATATLRQALAIGADSAVHVVDPALLGADVQLTAKVLAAVLTRLAPDVVLTGNQSTDGVGGVIPAILAELLDHPHATNLDAVEISEEGVQGTRSFDHGTMQVTAPLPAIVSITDRMPDARFPSFKDVSAAKKKPIETLSLAEVGVVAEDPSVPSSILVSVAAQPPRTGGVKVTDEGDGGTRIADFLEQNSLV